jgi:hypothetical protein
MCIMSTDQAPPFPAAAAEDGPARFRAAGKPIGRHWEDDDLGPPVYLRPGAATWIRLMPQGDPSRRWDTAELLKAARDPRTPLQPFFFSGLGVVCAEDRIGFYNFIGKRGGETNSFVFAFATGEVWSTDGWVLINHGGILLPSVIEQQWAKRLGDYGAFLKRLGLGGPYRWEAGMLGARQYTLQYPLPNNQMRDMTWRGPECQSDVISVQGIYDPARSPTTALLPFFQAIYESCDIKRPDYLPQK